MPVLDRLGGELPVSIDTSKAAVARAALERGAILVNDVTALRGDPELADVVADAGAYLCLMHMQGEPGTMQAEPRYDDVAAEVASFLEERLAFAVAQGIPEERICLDPGIGFGKTVAHNLELVRRLDVLVALGRPVLVGFSRKSSLRTLTGSDDLLGSERRGCRRRLRARRDDPARPRREAARRRAHRGRRDLVITVEVSDLRVFGRHGVHEEERERGQDFLFDVELDVGAARDERPARGRRRLRRGRARRAGGLGLRSSTRCSRRSPRRLRTSSSGASRRNGCACACGSRKSGRRGSRARWQPPSRDRDRGARSSAWAPTSATARATLRAAVDALADEAGIEVVAVSTLRETEPVGVGEQPPYLNGVVALETTLAARELLDRLLAVEQRFGRVRVPGEHGPRTLDLDLLLYGDELIEEPGLTVPHPRLHERALRPRAACRAGSGPRLARARDVESLLSGVH